MSVTARHLSDIQKTTYGFFFPWCGVDEAGRGPLAGPVVTACVYIPENMRDDSGFLALLKDSKTLSAKKRQAAYDIIREKTLYHIEIAEIDEIDSINIFQATMQAMKRASEKLCREQSLHPDCILIDGNHTPKDMPHPSKAIIKGDSLYPSISAASILAKVYRDKLMAGLATEHPHYGWERNAGYGTKEHLNALKKHGVTPHHRRSFAPVKALLSQA